MANSTADGSVVIDVDMNVSQAEKRLGKLRGDIKKTEKEIADATAERDESKQKSIFQGAELDAEKAKLQEIKDRLADIRAMSKDKGINIDTREEYKAQIPAIRQDLSDQQARIRMLQTEYNKTENAIDGYNRKIGASSQKLDDLKTEAGILTQEIDMASKSQGLFKKSADESGKAMTRFNRRIVELVKSAFIFNVISAGLRSIQQITMKYIKTNDEARQAIAQMEGALLTLAQPLIEVLIPAFTVLLNVLTRIITLIAQFVSALFGKTIKQSRDGAKALYKEANAIEAVGESADEATGSLAGFDEINTISTDSAGGAGRFGSGSEIMPDFDFNPGKYKDMIDELMVYLSGALLAIGAILLFSGANIPLGLGLMVLGAAILAEEIAENWGAVDGKVKEAVNNMLIFLGGALLVIGAILAFSGANIPLGIGLMIVGAAMLATAAKLNWGELGEETRKAITDTFIVIGTFLIALGAIIALSGANIPLGIGLMIAGAASLAAAAVLDWDYFSSHIKEIVTTITVLLGASLLVLGAILAFSGANILLGIGLMVVGAASLAAAVALNWNSIVAAIQGPFGKIMAIVSGALLVLGIILCCCGILPLGIALIAVGAVGLVAVTALNWNAILDKIKSVFNDIKSWWNKNAAKYFTLDYWKNKGNDIIDGFKAGIKEKWDGLTKWFSGIWNDLFGNKKVSVGVSGSSSAGNYNSGPRTAARFIPEIPPQNIPRLAQGAVIPPNREFMAVLGDQRNGTNLEAPEDLIRKIVREESGGGDGQVVMLLQSILEAVKAGQVIMVDKAVLGRTARDGINDITIKSGKFALLF